MPARTMKAASDLTNLDKVLVGGRWCAPIQVFVANDKVTVTFKHGSLTVDAAKVVSTKAV